MNRAIKYALGFALAAGIGHVATILAAPRVIMNTAIERISQGGKVINQFQFGPRTTQNSRGVVRPSPDLAYSTCVYDLSGGPILVEAAPSPDQGYVSISVFDARTDNIGVFDTTQYPQGIRFVLAREGQAVPAGHSVVRARYDRGVILDRRLAPNAELFAVADKARRADKCGPLTPA
jgi:uncharacterized membrane protein